MSRRLQYLGLLLFASCVIIYLRNSFTSHTKGRDYKLTRDTNIRHVVTKVTRRFNEDSFQLSRDHHAALDKKSEPLDADTQHDNSKTEHRAEKDNVPTEDYKLPKLITKSNVSDRFGGDDFKEKRHLAFLKVHKAASTTLQTMFFRFGFERNLSFILSEKGNYISPSAKDIVPPLHGDHYDIICNHGIFNYETYSSLMPNDTVYLAVVRNPLDQFISAVNYYTEVYKFKYLMDIPGDRLENLILHPEKYDKPLSYTMNSMARDFGFQRDHFFSASNTGALRYLDKLGKIFDFVLVAEYMDESLILMKRLLKWSLKDILYIPKNVRGPENTIREHLLASFRQRNKLDYMIYEYFYNRFRVTLKDSEESVQRETDHFKHVLVTVQNWCLDSLFGELNIEASEWNRNFVITTRDCQLMTKHEFTFINLLKNGTKPL